MKKVNNILQQIQLLPLKKDKNGVSMLFVK